MESLQEYYNKHKEQALSEYLKFLRFESVSTDPKYKDQVLACADWLAEEIKALGFTVEKWPTNGHPVIFASDLKAGPDKPTLLIYNHYDVQPVDPLNEWKSPPFDPTIREGQVYARGAEDNKGQCFYVLQALKGLLNRNKSLPINIKWCIEGEEECGSHGLSVILKDAKIQTQLKADYLVIVDMGLADIHSPAVTLGTRGLVTMEVRVKGSHTDLHSGSQGGIVYNPLHALVEMLASLRDSNGKVTIPGFYDDVVLIDKKQKEQISMQFDALEYEKMFGATPTGGEKEFTPLERAWNRPTLEINGITGGYGGEGFKTVIPAQVKAKVSCRLVPNQDPKKVGSLVADHLRKIAPPGITVEVEVYSGDGKAIRASPTSGVATAFRKAYEELYHKPCEAILSGGSIPIITNLAVASNAEVVLMGFGLPDDLAHAPNEHFGIDRLEKGFYVIYRAIEILGEKS